ncbi:MAG TPA: hypothetical protein VD973_05195 [Symbiobacteriaceae bacterium]|nr:hypothetical protein [Symbiobacteriaceae bacterium]
MSMMPESQAVLREFNRRLRLALREAPNHVRVEAALEVESHVMDVLSRSGGKEPEGELVARVLNGFGSPEEYAQAILSQMPEGAAVTVSGGLREVGLAAGDLVRGTFRLGLAIVRRSIALAVTTVRLIWQGAGAAAAYTREPAARAARWARINAAAGAYGLRRFTRFLFTRGGETAATLGRSGRRTAVAIAGWSQAGARGTSLLVQRLIRAATWLLNLVWRLLRWTLRAAGVAALAGLTLLALGVAGFAALAPDVTGWFVQQAQGAVAYELGMIRMRTIGSVDMVAHSKLVQTGTMVLNVAMLLALLLAGIVVYVAWGSRRRRSTAASDH